MYQIFKYFLTFFYQNLQDVTRSRWSASAFSHLSTPMKTKKLFFCHFDQYIPRFKNKFLLSLNDKPWVLSHHNDINPIKVHFRKIVPKNHSISTFVWFKKVSGPLLLKTLCDCETNFAFRVKIKAFDNFYKIPHKNV